MLYLSGCISTLFACVAHLRLHSQELRLFDFAGVGIVIAVYGLLYMAVCSKCLLPSRGAASTAAVDGDASPADSHRQYLASFLLKRGSAMAGRTILSSGLTTARDVEFVGLVSGGQPKPWVVDHVLREGDE
jgi:hypothetical protein